MEMSQRVSKLDEELSKRMKSMSEALEHASKQKQVSSHAYGTLVELDDAALREYEAAQLVYEEHFETFLSNECTDSEHGSEPSAASVAESDITPSDGEVDPSTLVNLDDGFAELSNNSNFR